MPNAKVLSEKQAIVAALVDDLKAASSGVLVDYKGITVAEDTALRHELRENGVEYAVVKNTLLRRALDDVDLGELDEVLNGTTSMAISKEDPHCPHAHRQQVRQADGRPLQHQGRLHGRQSPPSGRRVRLG